MKLKKHFICFVCITLALLMTACSATNTPTPSQEPTTMPEKEENPKAQVVEPAGGLGLEYVYNDGIQEAMVDENTVLPESMSVFHNAYPYGQGGAMFEITEAHKQKLVDELCEFMVIFRDEMPNAHQIVQTSELREDSKTYQDEDIVISSSTNGLTLEVSVNQLPQEFTVETVVENPLLQSAMEYLGIVNPEISRVDEYNQDGVIDSYDITIAENGNDLMQTVLNQTISKVRIVHYGDLDTSLVFITRKDMPEEYQSFPTVSLEDAVAAARAAHSELPAEATVTADVFYSTSIHPDYFIPCYRLYFKSTETNVPQCVEMTMIDLTVFEASLTAEP